MAVSFRCKRLGYFEDEKDAAAPGLPIEARRRKVDYRGEVFLDGEGLWRSSMKTTSKCAGVTWQGHSNNLGVFETELGATSAYAIVRNEYEANALAKWL